MTQKITPGTAVLLVIPPLLWAGNAVVGRLVHELIPPITLNFIRWVLAFAILLPLAHGVLRADSPLWPHWRRYALLGLLGIGAYNALQYMALQTSTPINVTLVGSSMPVWMLVVGALFFGAAVTRRQLLGALLSVCGVLLVLSRGEWSQLLAFRLVPGDLFMLLATISWAFYSWLLSRTSDAPARLARIVGKHCESGDIVVRDTWVPDDVVPGDLLGVAATGAYCYSMSSRYNMLGRPAVVVVRDGKARLILRRETVDDLLSLEVG